MSRDYTLDQFRCLSCKCGYRGPAEGKVVIDHHGDGARETTLQDLRCPMCLSEDIQEIEDYP